MSVKSERLQFRPDGETQRSKKEMRQESVVVRKRIEAPEHFVSVFHETKGEYIPGIDAEGLRLGSEKGIGAGRMEAGNAMFNEFIPDAFKFAINRNVIFAYPFLDDGHDQRGADQRFVQQKKDSLESNYDMLKKFDPDYLENDLHVSSAEEYVRKMTDPKFLQSSHPGEVLELKVDPKKCFIGDVDHIDTIVRIGGKFSESDDVKEYAEKYWKGVIVLEDFLRWYKKPEYDETGNNFKNIDDYKEDFIDTNAYHVLAGAADTLPDYITKPEVLIPMNVSQEYIRVLNDDDIPKAV